MEAVNHERIKDAAHKATNFADSMIDKGADLAHQAVTKGSEIKRVVTDRSAEALKKSEAFIKENPHTTVLSGFGLGLLVGAGLAFLMMSRD